MNWTGIPFAWGGSSRAGADCAGLVLAYLREEFGIDLPDPPDRDEESWRVRGRERMLEYLRLHCRQIDPPGIRGDIVLIHMYQQCAHAGILIDPAHVLHTWGPGESSRISPVSSFGHRILGYWRIV